MTLTPAEAKLLKETYPNINTELLGEDTARLSVSLVQPSKRRNSIKEKDWQKIVIDLAHVNSWKVAHFRGAWSKDGKRFITPVAADGAGFPDLVLARMRGAKKQVLFVELKTEKGKCSTSQLVWLEYLNGEVWRPSMLEQIAEDLK